MNRSLAMNCLMQFRNTENRSVKKAKQLQNAPTRQTFSKAKCALLREPAQRSRSCQWCRCHRDGQADEITDRVLSTAGARPIIGRKPNPARIRPLQQFQLHHRDGGDLQSDGEYLPGDEGCRGTSGIFTERLQDCGKGAGNQTTHG